MTAVDEDPANDVKVKRYSGEQKAFASTPCFFATKLQSIYARKFMIHKDINSWLETDHRVWKAQKFEFKWLLQNNRQRFSCLTFLQYIHCAIFWAGSSSPIEVSLLEDEKEQNGLSDIWHEAFFLSSHVGKRPWWPTESSKNGRKEKVKG